MSPEQVAAYLTEHPEFFEENIELLENLRLPHPYAEHSISLTERQLIALRDRIKLLEKKIHDLYLVAKQNDVLQHKVHEFVTTLFGAPDLTTLKDMVPYLLRDIFSAGHVALRIWHDETPHPDALDFAKSHHHPVCLHRAINGITGWFGEHESLLLSFAYIPLYAGHESIGMVVLGSEDNQRYYPGMATDFLQQIADAISAALHPHLAHA